MNNWVKKRTTRGEKVIEFRESSSLINRGLQINIQEMFFTLVQWLLDSKKLKAKKHQKLFELVHSSHGSVIRLKTMELQLQHKVFE